MQGDEKSLRTFAFAHSCVNGLGSSTEPGGDRDNNLLIRHMLRQIHLSRYN